MTMVITEYEEGSEKGYDGKVWKKDSKIQSADSDSQYLLLIPSALGYLHTRITMMY